MVSALKSRWDNHFGGMLLMCVIAAVETYLSEHYGAPAMLFRSFFVDRSKSAAPVIPDDRCKCGTLLYSIKYPPQMAAVDALKKICGALLAVSPSTANALPP